MASIRKRGNSWIAQINKLGQRPSATFSTKAEATAWATATEAEIIAGKNGKVPNKPFSALLERYRDEVSVKKKGEKWERTRINMILNDPVARVALAVLSERDIAGWRDRRLERVSDASVRREWNILSAACTIAVNEWKWLTVHPMKTVKRPAAPRSRERLFSCDEIEAITAMLGWDDGIIPITTSARVGHALMFAIETGMRCGEICALEWRDIVGNVAEVRGGKTHAATRRVPLTGYAQFLIKLLNGVTNTTVFELSPSQVDALFRKARDRAGVDGLHFHDSRATAITRLARKLDILSLARMVGHRDLKMLQVYFRESAEDIAERL